MADYSAQIATASRLIRDKGMSMTYISVTESGELDPVTGRYPVTTEEIEVQGVRTQPTATEIQRGQFQGISLVILVAGDAIPTADTSDVIRFGGRDYDIKEIQRVAPAEQVILYKFGVKDAGPAGSSVNLRGVS